MIWTIYIVILTYFALGFVGFYVINRKKDREAAHKSWTKFGTYFLIIHLLFFSISLLPNVFVLIAAVIVAVSFYEFYNVYRKSDYQRPRFFIGSLVMLGFFSVFFVLFSLLDSRLILFSFLILSIFDSFSQIAGQIWGRRLLFPKLSPQKTVEGLIGGAIAAAGSSWLIGSLIENFEFHPVFLAAGIVAFAFLGDVLSSGYKRKYQVKDFSNLIPGHGGFPDRFDSLIAGGAFVAFSDIVIGFF